MQKQDDLYISLLKYGYDNLLNGVIEEECWQHLKSKGFFDSGNQHDRQQFSRLFQESFYYTQDSKRTSDGKNHVDIRYFIELESYFRFLEYQELKETRDSATFAKWTAIIAIFISIIGTAVSIYFSYKVLYTPISLDQEQFSKIENMKFDQSNLNHKLDSIIENQKNLPKAAIEQGKN